MKAIIACDPQGGIGYQNRLPWDSIKGDLTRFKHLTSGGVVIMGRNTWESLPIKPLPKRVNFVVSGRDLDLPAGAFAVKDIEQFKDIDSAWIIGGAKLIESAWNYINEIHLTQTLTKYRCDTFIDLLKLKNEFDVIHGFEHEDHFYTIYRRK